MIRSRLSDIIAGSITRTELAVGIYLVPGFPDWATSTRALELCVRSGVDFVEFPAMSGARWSGRTGVTVARALHDAEPYREASATAWLLSAPVRVAVVYGSAWQAADTWSAPAPLRAGVSGYLFESDPTDIGPYALAAAEHGAVIVPAVDVTTPGLSETDRRLLSLGGGFVYGSLGPRTGSRTASLADLAHKRSAIRSVRPDLPVCAAFGIRQPADIEILRGSGDCAGVIIGSAALEHLERGISTFSIWLKDIVMAAK